MNSVLAIYLGMAILFFFLAMVLLRWIFGVNELLKYQRIQIGLLVEMAKKAGVDKGEIGELMKAVK